MRIANGFISREDTTRRACLFLLVLCGLARGAGGEIDAKLPYLSAAGKQALKPGAQVNRWFEIELKNTSAQERTVQLRVFQCNGTDEGISGSYNLAAGATRAIPLTRELPCAQHLGVGPGKIEKPPSTTFIVVAMLQPAGAGVDLAVLAQVLHGDSISTHSSPGQVRPAPQKEIRAYMKFASALLLNPSASVADVRACAAPSSNWIRFSGCMVSPSLMKLPPGAAVLLDEPSQNPAFSIKTNDRAGFIEVIPFEFSQGQKKHYQVDSNISFSEPKP